MLMQWFIITTVINNRNIKKYNNQNVSVRKFLLPLDIWLQWVSMFSVLIDQFCLNKDVKLKIHTNWIKILHSYSCLHMITQI